MTQSKMNRKIQPTKSVVADDHAKLALAEAQNEHAAAIPTKVMVWMPTSPNGIKVPK